MKSTFEMQNYITENVRGTFHSLSNLKEDFMKEFGIEREQDAQALMEDACTEAEVERCEQCGWWVEMYELDEHNFCQDCHEEEE